VPTANWIAYGSHVDRFWIEFVTLDLYTVFVNKRLLPHPKLAVAVSINYKEKNYER
jgi:hypothetical protein